MHADMAIIGGGIVGLATARALQRRFPRRRLVVFEKEPDVGMHQTGHNSGVIHAGIYYPPGSLKARLCVEGARRMREFCNDHDIAHQLCGKVIVAVDASEEARLEELYRRGSENGVQGLRWLSSRELRTVEPYAAGTAAIHSPYTGIVDFRQVARCLAGQLTQSGRVQIACRAPVRTLARRGGLWRIEAGSRHVEADVIVNCAGLYADRIARMAGTHPGVQIVPFRGEYFFLRPERQALVRGLIYPVPDPTLPFLGVHLTRTIHGGVEAGPNAVLAFAREGYRKTDFQPGDLWETLTYRGFMRLALRYWRAGIAEVYRSCWKAEFARSLQRLVPAIREEDLTDGGAGVRAQAVDAQGSLITDFYIQQSEAALHVLNAPSPAATASLAIGDQLAAMVDKEKTA